jgi:hypothetical protein
MTSAFILPPVSRRLRQPQRAQIRGAAAFPRLHLYNILSLVSSTILGFIFPVLTGTSHAHDQARPEAHFRVQDTVLSEDLLVEGVSHLASGTTRGNK